MNSLIIAYDRNRGDDYKPLIKELERLGAERLQFSLWELKGTTNAVQICQHLRRYLDTGDRLDVFAKTFHSAWPPGRGRWNRRNAFGGLFGLAGRI